MVRRPVPVVALLAALALGLGACSDGDSDGGASADAPADESTPAAESATAPAPEPEIPPEPEPAPVAAEPGLPEYTAGYREFAGLVERDIPPDAAAPHGGVKSVFATDDRDPSAGGFPDGTVVVKEGERGGDAAAIIAVMRKVAGVDPDHGDWEFIEWSRPDPGSPYTVLARDQVCWGCHMGAIDGDWVFTASP